MSDPAIKALSPERRSTTSPISSSGTGHVRQLPVHALPSPLPGAGPERRGEPYAQSNAGSPTAPPTPRWSTTATGLSPGRSTDRLRRCPASITARSTSPPPNDSPTTGSPASRSSLVVADTAWQRSPCAEPSSSLRRPAADWSRATPTTLAVCGRRTRHSSTTALARCTSARASPATDRPKARATASWCARWRRARAADRGDLRTLYRRDASPRSASGRRRGGFGVRDSNGHEYPARGGSAPDGSYA